MHDKRDQDLLNADARHQAVSSLRQPTGSVSPGISYKSLGRVLIFGPEHRVRLAAVRLAREAEVCGLVTEAMPESITATIEATPELPDTTSLIYARLASLTGYLGRFDARIDQGGAAVSISDLVFKSEFCDAVLDLGSSPIIDCELLPPGYFHPHSDAALDQSLAELASLKGEFEKPRYFQINASLCAHSGSQMTGCTRCLDACPADAIRSIDGAIQIDGHLCHGAGGCATSCPTGAIRYDAPEPLRLHDALGQLLDAYASAGGLGPSLLVHDAGAGARWWAQHGEALPGHWLPLQIEELGAAGIDLWMQALARGANAVVLLDSGALPAGIRRILEREIGLANRMLEGLGVARRVRLLRPEQLAGGADHGADAAPPVLRGQVAAYHKRQLTSEALSHLYRHSTARPAGTTIALPAGSPFGDLTIRAEACTLCYSCVSICPTKALKSGGDRPELSFTEDRCVQCGLCVAACPEKVLGLAPRFQADPQLRTTSRTLKKEEPFRCIRCNKPFTTHSMVSRMEAKLAGHRMFAGAALARLKMCGDCRVIDQALDPDSGLIGLAGSENVAAVQGTSAVLRSKRP